jgi:hypothetical protein
MESLPNWISISAKRVESEALEEGDFSPTDIEDPDKPRLLRSVSCIDLPRSHSGLFQRRTSESSLDGRLTDGRLTDDEMTPPQTVSYNPSQFGHFLSPSGKKGVERGRVGWLSDCEIKVEVPFVIGGFPNYEGGRRSVDTLPVYVGGKKEEDGGGEGDEVE